MADPYTGEIRMFAGNYAPEGWAFCDGQILPVAQYQALFSIMGTTYGGNGHTTFGIPDLKDRTPMGEGAGPGLTPRVQGQPGGELYTPLTESQMPRHTHTVVANQEVAELKEPQGALLAKGKGYKQGFFDKPLNLYNGEARNQSMSAEAIQPAGGGQGHLNVQPCLAINFIICLEGIYPPRSQ